MYNPWDVMQNEISDWADRNFGDNPCYRLYLGMVEEIGEFYSSLEEINQSAKQRRTAMIDALGDWGVYTLNLCESVGLSFSLDIAAHEEGKIEPINERQLLGIQALGAQAILKHDQGIRGVTAEERKKRLCVMVSMMFRWAQYQSRLYALPQVLDIVQRVWSEVKKRDWKKNPVNAAEVV